jgi:ATP-dependent Clp protease protease subunit
MNQCYLIFCGLINQDTAPRLTNAFALATKNGISRIHLAIQSSGGTVADAVFVYNLMRNLPFELVTYNCGQVSSAAVTLFLGGKERVASNHSMFMLHRTYLPVVNGQKANQMQQSSDYLAREDKRIEDIISEQGVKLTDATKTTLEHHDVYLMAQDALECGLVTKLGAFVPPSSGEVYNL